MRVVSLHIRNFRSFGLTGKTINFPSSHSALVGKNNSGKSNIIRALTIILGSRTPLYYPFSEEDYFDINYPVEIEVIIGDFNTSDKSHLMAIPNLTRQQQGALSTKIADGSATISFFLRKNSVEGPPPDTEEEAGSTQDTFDIKLWGFQVHRKKDLVRKNIISIITAPPLRNHEDHLSASRWTDYGQLMKDVLENSPQFTEIKEILTNLNEKIKEAFRTQKDSLLKGTQVVSSVEDIEFLLTKGNNPAELLRNLEIFIKESNKLFNIDNVGTGTQSAIIIAMLELALKNKFSTKKLFCIEEPECFIHPHGVRYLGSLIREITGNNSMQVIVSTHSLSLLPAFVPNEIIKVVKVNGETDIKQATSLSASHYKRFINQNSAEMFYSDRIVFVEGPTEKHLLCELDKGVEIDPTQTNSASCNLDRINVGVIELNSMNSLTSYVTIAQAFDIPYMAMVDKDFLTSSACRSICTKLSITYQTQNLPQLIRDLKSKNIIVNSRGEIEDLFSDQEISTISGKTLLEVQQFKAQYPSKTSKAFKEIFDMGKAEYAIRIADYYLTKNLTSPLDALIRNLYNNNIQAITI